MMPVIAVLATALATQSPDTQLLSRALSDLRSHPVEIVGRDTVPTSVRGHAVLDSVDARGPVLFLAIIPKYRQTPTVIAYRALDSTRVERLYEGLAPGPLVAVSGREIDTHTLGNGIDMTIQGKTDSNTLTRLLASARSRNMHIVRYPKFFHVDQRPHAAGYVDAEATAPRSTAETCEAFEFPPVEALASGHLSSDSTGNYLAALTATQVVLYRFTGIRNDGRFQKETRVIGRPADIATLGVTESGFLVGVTRDDRRVALDVIAKEVVH